MPLMEHDVAAASLRLRVNLLGGIALVGYVILTLLSYVQAPALWRAEDARNVIAFFDDLAVRFPLLGYYKAFPSSEAVIATYWAPLLLASLAPLLLVLLLSRQATAADEGTVKLIFNWSLAFAGICALAFPVFTQDMWLSAVWGRMIAAGVNPYYTLFAPEDLTSLPLDHFPMVMSYGPLWGILSAFVMLLAGGSVLAAAVLFKSVLTAAWIGALVLIGRITEAQPVRDRCVAVTAFGWLPAGVSQSLAEGHNDIVLVAGALLWLYLLLRQHWAAPVALVASALCKYTTLPLLLVDVVGALRREGMSLSRFLMRQIAPVLLGVAILAVFYRSMAFFDGLKVVSEWHFLQPGDAIDYIEHLIGVPLFVLSAAVTMVFPLHAAYWLAVAFWAPTAASLTKAAAATMAAVMFSIVSHVWPWYVIWALAFTVVVPGWWLSRFVLAVAFVMPFAPAAWWIEPVDRNVELAALVTYAVAALWTVLTRQRQR